MFFLKERIHFVLYPKAHLGLVFGLAFSAKIGTSVCDAEASLLSREPSRIDFFLLPKGCIQWEIVTNIIIKNIVRDSK